MAGIIRNVLLTLALACSTPASANVITDWDVTAGEEETSAICRPDANSTVALRQPAYAVIFSSESADGSQEKIAAAQQLRQVSGGIPDVSSAPLARRW